MCLSVKTALGYYEGSQVEQSMQRGTLTHLEKQQQQTTTAAACFSTQSPLAQVDIRDRGHHNFEQFQSHRVKYFSGAVLQIDTKSLVAACGGRCFVHTSEF